MLAELNCLQGYCNKSNISQTIELLKKTSCNRDEQAKQMAFPDWPPYRLSPTMYVPSVSLHPLCYYIAPLELVVCTKIHMKLHRYLHHSRLKCMTCTQKCRLHLTLPLLQHWRGRLVLHCEDRTARAVEKLC